ncbi:MAG: MraY family glycosyltransferase, partial [Bacteroidota bacterium]
FIGILLATMLGFLLGLADDAYNTRPFLKLMTQITCGIILMSTGTKISLSYLEPVNYIITIFWVVGMMNSLNMLDNMDAITTTVSISIILSALTMMIFGKDLSSVYFMILTGVMGALIGFLYFNWHPSKMYMGDTGSQFIGVFLAAIGIKYFWNSTPPSGDLISARNLILPMLVFILPIVDTTTVTINRLAKGRSPFVGGKDHTTHALAYLGLGDRQVAAVFWIISILSVLFVFIIEKYLKEWNHIYTAIFGVYFLTILSLFFSASRIAENSKA